VTKLPSNESIRRPYDPEEPINWLEWNQKISRFFTVGEVLQYDPQRVPTGAQTIGNILMLCDELDRMREAWGSPVGVTSWYRPPAVNRAVKGAQFSQHLSGSAVDLYTMDGRDREFEAWLDASWGGALGYGAAKGLGFTHLDLRGGGWKRGAGEIRWHY
jgi:putative chitinase